MNDTTLSTLFREELEAETTATRKCLERVPEKLFDWKPHEKSMAMGYLAFLVAEIPKWITHIVEKGEIDFATFEHASIDTTVELIKHFDENIQGAKEALRRIPDEVFAEPFELKRNGQLLFRSSKKENVGSSLNHWVHHRGQLTVYLRLNDIAVPSIYGPSADERTF